MICKTCEEIREFNPNSRCDNCLDRTMNYYHDEDKESLSEE
jgi:hypothetical protein